MDNRIDLRRTSNDDALSREAVVAAKANHVDHLIFDPRADGDPAKTPFNEMVRRGAEELARRPRRDMARRMDVTVAEPSRRASSKVRVRRGASFNRGGETMQRTDTPLINPVAMMTPDMAAPRPTRAQIRAQRRAARRRADEIDYKRMESLMPFLTAMTIQRGVLDPGETIAFFIRHGKIRAQVAGVNLDQAAIADRRIRENSADLADGVPDMVRTASRGKGKGLRLYQDLEPTF